MLTIVLVFANDIAKCRGHILNASEKQGRFLGI